MKSKRGRTAIDFREIPEMPRGTRHVETGILRPSQFGLYALEMDGGGIWQLDVGWGWKAQKLIGQRVTVEGTRAGFNLLDVKRMRSAM